MALSDITDLAVHPAIIRKATAAAVVTAVTVSQEPYDGSHYTIMRRSLATQVLQDAATWGAIFAWGLAAAPTTTTSADTDDTAVVTAVAALWDCVAGAYRDTAPPTSPR